MHLLADRERAPKVAHKPAQATPWVSSKTDQIRKGDRQALVCAP